jgi:hypothetical protein
MGPFPAIIYRQCQSEHQFKNHFMSSNINPIAVQQDMKKPPFSTFFLFIAGVIVTGD